MNTICIVYYILYPFLQAAYGIWLTDIALLKVNYNISYRFIIFNK